MFKSLFNKSLAAWFKRMSRMKSFGVFPVRFFSFLKNGLRLMPAFLDRSSTFKSGLDTFAFMNSMISSRKVASLSSVTNSSGSRADNVA